MTVTIEQMVQREVNVCLSSLISTLASGGGRSPRELGRELAELCDQAFELACRIPDYEEAAIQAGWSVYAGVWRHKDAHEGSVRDATSRGYLSAQELCEANEIEPYEREVYEWWAISTWLAKKLSAQGDRVDTDFAGMNVWARTCSGQGIASDGVIQRIYADMIKA